MYGLPGLWYNPEKILGAKSATKTTGELSIFSALLSETFCIIGDGGFIVRHNACRSGRGNGLVACTA